MPAYLSLPPAGHGPGLVVLHEDMGLNAHIRQIGDRFAGAGYAALAPDLFWKIAPGTALGYGEADMDRAFEIYQDMDADATVADIAATNEQLRARDWCTGRVGVVGFCLGGRLAYQASAAGGFDCAVGYYAVGLERLLELDESITCPLLLHFGTLDALAPPRTVARIAARPGERPNVQVCSYPGADHGFNCDARPAFHPQAAQLAWERTLALPGKKLASAHDGPAH